MDFISIIDSFAATANLLSKRGWAEKNAGNISVNITGVKHQSFLQASDVLRLDSNFKNLAANELLITATNSKMSDLAQNPEANICLVKINEDASGYTVFSADEKYSSNKPTSELLSHLALHSLLLEKGDGRKSIVHTHPTELIALSHLPFIKDSESVTRLIWNMHPESIIFLPEGIGYVPYCLTGSKILAAETLEILKKYRTAIWEKHGCIATGEMPVDAFDLIDVTAKSARIYFLCKSAGFEPEGLTEAQIEELIDAFGKK